MSIILFFSFDFLCAMEKEVNFDIKKQIALFGTLLKKDMSTIKKIIATTDPIALPFLLNNHLRLNSQSSYTEVAQFLKKDDYIQAEQLLKAMKEASFHALNALSPLGLTVFMDNEPAMKLLLQNGADINYTEEGAPTPLEIAVQYQPQHISFLRAKGARVDQDQSLFFIPCIRDYHDYDTHKDPSLFTFLKSEQERNMRAVTELVEAGFPIKQCEHTLGLTPLHIACNNGKYALAKLFLDKGIPVDIPTKNSLSSIQWSIMSKQNYFVGLLLEYGANIKQKTKKGSTLIECITFKSEYLLASTLMRYGAPYPISPMHQDMVKEGIERQISVCSKKYKEFVHALFKNQTNKACQEINFIYGNELNTTDSWGYNYLHWAVVRENKAVVDQLLSLNAQATASKNSSLGQLAHSIPIIGFYIFEPINLHSKTQIAKRTALDWACYLKNDAIKQALKDAGATQ